MEYYELVKYADNAVGAVFNYCTSTELEEQKENFEPDYVNEVSKEEYDEGVARNNRKAMRLFTGYPN